MAEWKLTLARASFPAEMQIVDIIIGAPVVETTAVTPATRAGGIFARRTVRHRPIKVTFVLMEGDAVKRLRLARQVISVLQSNAEMELLSTVNNMRIMCTCTKLPDISAAQYWETLSFELTAQDPYWYSTALKTSTLSSTTNNIKQSDADVTSIAWKITMNNYTGQEEISWNVCGQSITLLPLGRAGRLVINGTAKSIMLDNDSVMSMMSLGSRFFDGDTSIYPVM